MRKLEGTLRVEPLESGQRLIIKTPQGEEVAHDLTTERSAELHLQLAPPKRPARPKAAKPAKSAPSSKAGKAPAKTRRRR